MRPMTGGQKIDFEAEGLLEGVEGQPREARLELLKQLAGEGCSLEELREAVVAGRLTLLPVERALAGQGPRYTGREIAAEAGIDLDVLQRFRAALGIPYPDPDERRAT
jgi:adenylate cyclase